MRESGGGLTRRPAWNQIHNSFGFGATAKGYQPSKPAPLRRIAGSFGKGIPFFEGPFIDNARHEGVYLRVSPLDLNAVKAGFLELKRLKSRLFRYGIRFLRRNGALTLAVHNL